jgi:hypothetical protein
MLLGGPVRLVCIAVCIVLIVLPAAACLHWLRPPHVSSAIEFVHVLLPFLLFALVQLCFAEGRARERAERERRGRAAGKT